MAKEVNRYLLLGAVRVEYDDGSFKDFPLEEPPEGVKADADADKSINSGHVFTPEELQ